MPGVIGICEGVVLSMYAFDVEVVGGHRAERVERGNGRAVHMGRRWVNERLYDMAKDGGRVEGLVGSLCIHVACRSTCMTFSRVKVITYHRGEVVLPCMRPASGLSATEA